MNRNARFVSFCALFLCCTLLCTALFYKTDQMFRTQVTDTQEPQSPLIILDAGHGGEDGGATGTNGALEKELNLSLTRCLADLLRGAGYSVLETRTEDKLLYDAGTVKGHKKQGDLQNRLAFTREHPNSIFISIHMNTFPTAACEGTQVWYSQNNEESMELALAIQESVKAWLQPQNNRKVKAATSSIYILKHAQTPAVLIECGFLSTPAECERLSSDIYQKQLALCLFSAISKKIQGKPCTNTQNIV